MGVMVKRLEQFGNHGPGAGRPAFAEERFASAFAWGLLLTALPEEP